MEPINRSSRDTDPWLEADLDAPVVPSAPHQTGRNEPPRHTMDAAAQAPTPEAPPLESATQRSPGSGSTIGARATGGRQRVTLVARRYAAVAESWLLEGGHASSRAVEHLAGYLGARGKAIWAGMRTVSGPSHVSAVGTRTVRDAWGAAARGIARTRASTLTLRRENPVSFAVLSYAMVGAVMFLLGRSSALPPPAKPLGETSSVVTVLDSAPVAPSAIEARPRSEQPPAVAPARASDETPPVTLQAAAAPLTEAPQPAATPSGPERPPASPRSGPPFRGSLAVSSSPRGAQVFINGVRAGTTPLSLGNLPVGSRAVRVVQDGYEPWYSTVQIVFDRRTTTVAQLRPLRRER
jgi:hypothetical protein